MPKNETDNFITKCKQIFMPEVNVTELCQKYKLKADGIYLLHRDKQNHDWETGDHHTSQDNAPFGHESIAECHQTYRNRSEF